MVSVTFVYALSRRDVEGIKQEIRQLQLAIETKPLPLNVGKTNAAITLPADDDSDSPPVFLSNGIYTGQSGNDHH